MRRHLQILTVLAALAAPCGMAQAQTLNAAKIDSINKAADSFVALAKDSPRPASLRAIPTRPPSRCSIPCSIPRTSKAESRCPGLRCELLHDWNRATQKIGLVYYLAGTGTNEVGRGRQRSAEDRQGQ